MIKAKPKSPATATASKRRDQATSKANPKAPRQTKTALLLDMLGHPEGASFDALREATDWQRHTLRAALSRLRKAGHAVEHITEESGPSTYRIAGAGAGEGEQ
ncbi:DUF3489 domain-containing protein [Limibacillus halophilus]|uniref:DUF3489 domain-containing protein n=1 Tax=Limibacillus halophilus TaxID=1579333 RepID=A0A839SPW7_9PROT|nr:DUF3489 domain-containing protein [Limibacillus halophilus]MBB3064492.1 hypothetical protein [Limibacillus halophilus]